MIVKIKKELMRIIEDGGKNKIITQTRREAKKGVSL